jgi:hypothetical protein
MYAKQAAENVNRRQKVQGNKLYGKGCNFDEIFKSSKYPYSNFKKKSARIFALKTKYN